jgi:hypothetical protein
MERETEKEEEEEEAAATYFKLLFRYYLEEGAVWFRLPIVFEWKPTRF